MQTNKYVIDGDSDGVIESNFFSQLKNMFLECKGDNNNNNKNENQGDCCLLTKEPLHPIHIVLECGHKFNYVPIYREIVAQKTMGVSSNGYYNSHSLKKNEIKCPYCRNIQDKLLPYLEYDGVKKIHSVNHPEKMSMICQPCMHSETSLHPKKSKKVTSCKQHAVECNNGKYVCKKHYELSFATPQMNTVIEPSQLPTSLSSTSLSSKCGVILRYGKNKGSPCSNPLSCRIHKKV